jgi:hypothetical protein
LLVQVARMSAICHPTLVFSMSQYQAPFSLFQAASPTTLQAAPRATPAATDFQPATIPMNLGDPNNIPADLERLLDAEPGAWAKYRKAPTKDEQRLGRHAMEWLRAIPKVTRPLHTAINFPHVTNRLAATWDKPEELQACFDGLLNSKRQKKRKGFPPEVVHELRALLAYGGVKLPE